VKYAFVLDQKPPSGWPVKGMIQFDHMNLKYSPIDPPVLKDLNFIIQPAQKVCTGMIDLPSHQTVKGYVRSINIV
jgi:hypothetical protein